MQPEAPNRRPFIPVTAEMIADYMRAGHTRRQAAAHFSITYSPVTLRLSTAGMSGQFKAARKKRVGTCALCKSRPIKCGNRWLCDKCFRQHSEEDVWSLNTRQF